MKIFKNKYTRIFLSLVAGSLTNELIQVFSTDPNFRPQGEGLRIIFYSAAYYLVLTYFVNKAKERV